MFNPAKLISIDISQSTVHNHSYILRILDIVSWCPFLKIQDYTDTGVWWYIWNFVACYRGTFNCTLETCSKHAHPVCCFHNMLQSWAPQCSYKQERWRAALRAAGGLWRSHFPWCSITHNFPWRGKWGPSTSKELKELSVKRKTYWGPFNREVLKDFNS